MRRKSSTMFYVKTLILNLLLASTVTAAGKLDKLASIMRYTASYLTCRFGRDRRSEDYSFILHYLNGDCSWTVSGDLGGNTVDIPVVMGPQVMIEGTAESSERFTLKCTLSDGSVELLANVTVYGEYFLFLL